MSPRLVVGGRSDVGMQRRNNQDSLYAGPHLIAVADGVGGAAGGEVASRLTIGALVPLDTDPGTAADSPGGALAAAADRADTAIRDTVASDRALTGMGTTLSAILATDDALTLAHIGDSRAYLLRAGTLTQLTHDHTLVQSLIDEGQITAEEALTHPRRSWILRALDGRGSPELDVTTLDTQPGDRYLVCSDGLSSYVDERAITDGLAGGDPQAAADRLIDLALRAGGADNISCAVGDLAAADSEVQEPILAGAIAEIPATATPAEGAPAATSADPPTAVMFPPVASDGSAGELVDDEPQPTGRKRSIGRRLTAVAVIVIILVAAAVVGVVVDIHHRYYVAPSAGKVAIFRGVKGKSVAGHQLSSVQQLTNIPVSALPQSTRDNIGGGFDASSRQKANAIVTNLRTQACAAVTASPSPTPTALPSGTAPAPKTSAAPVTPVWCTASP